MAAARSADMIQPSQGGFPARGPPNVRAPSAVHERQRDVKPVRGHPAERTLGPLYQGRPVVQCLVQSQLLDVARTFDPVKVVVTHIQSRSLVILHERERRARYLFAHAQRRENGARQRRLARAEIALQRDGIADLQGCGNPRAQSLRVGQARQGEGLLKPLRILGHGQGSSPRERAAQRR